MVEIKNLPKIPTSVQEGADWERTLSHQITQEMRWGTITGVVVSHNPTKTYAHAVAMSLSPSNWKPFEVQKWEGAITPFAEELHGWEGVIPMLGALEKLHHVPDVIFVAGHGQAHVRRFGTACHVGHALQLPTIGVSSRFPLGGALAAKTYLGQIRRGTSYPVLFNGMKVGVELVTQEPTHPVYVSVGNMMSLDQAILLTLKAAPVYSSPEPLRQAEIELQRFKGTGV